MKLVGAPIVSNRELMPGINLIELDAPDVAGRARPGQFVMIGAGPAQVLPRPISIHGASREFGRLSLLFAVKGGGTSWLSQRRVGERVPLLGPLGNGFSVPQAEGRRLVLLAGGVGIAPLAFLASETCARHTTVVVMGVASAAKMYPAGLLPRGIALAMVTEDGSAGRRGLVSDVAPEHMAGADGVYACGPVGMYQAIQACRVGMGKTAPAVQVSLEVRMGCGIGACYGCTVRTRRGLRQVCRDGPVFDIDDVLWESVVC